MKRAICAVGSLLIFGIFVVRVSSQSRDAKSQISLALSSAPPSVAANATVGVMDDKGQVTELRHGTNGWTCLAPDVPPSHHDSIEHHPACFDKAGLQWIQSFEAGAVPKPDQIGYSYMLQGGSSWSNTDPHAKQLPAGQRDFIRIPPHIMILNARVANSSGFPSGQTDPDTHQPFVMFGDTPYAILIVPVS
jgi:hypothetical protein